MTYADDGKYETAIDYLKKCIAVSAPDESQVRKAYALLVNALFQSDLFEEAWGYCVQGLNHYPSDKELLFRQAMLHHHFGRLYESEQTYLRIINETEERHFTSIDVGLTGYKSRHNLALVYDDQKEYARAEEQWRTVIEMDDTNNTAWRGLGETLLKAEKYEEAEKLILQMSKDKEMQSNSNFLMSRMFELQGKFDSAMQTLQTCMDGDSDNLEPLRALCRVAFEHSTPQESLPLLNDLAKLSPDDASVFHNLGTTHLQMKQYQQAIAAYQRSLDLRPLSTETWHLLGHAYFNLGDLPNAQNAWREVLHKNPSHTEASQLLNSTI